MPLSWIFLVSLLLFVQSVRFPRSLNSIGRKDHGAGRLRYIFTENQKTFCVSSILVERRLEKQFCERGKNQFLPHSFRYSLPGNLPVLCGNGVKDSGPRSGPVPGRFPAKCCRNPNFRISPMKSLNPQSIRNRPISYQSAP